MKEKIFLGIDTSCDDTCVGICRGKEILANVRIMHTSNKRFGGVVPEVSARDHCFFIEKVIQDALDKAGISLNDIDVFAATAGPGMIGGLLVGYNFAKTLAVLTSKPFIPIHHLEGHLLVTLPSFPFLGCVVSGGHTCLLLCSSLGDYKLLAESRDDAAGEIFDKVAKHLGLDFPGGPEVEKMALKDSSTFSLPIPLRNKLDFSFSGLKTAFLRMNAAPERICKILQNTVAKVLKEKIDLAIGKTGISRVIVCGGVASNGQIRDELSFCEFAPSELCTDNGLMIARAAQYHYTAGEKTYLNIEVFSRKSLEDYFLALRKS